MLHIEETPLLLYMHVILVLVVAQFTFPKDDSLNVAFDSFNSSRTNASPS